MLLLDLIKTEETSKARTMSNAEMCVLDAPL